MDTLPFIDYVKEDKSCYPFAADKGWIDDDRDFLIGNSGGFLMNINFIFIGTEAFSETANYYKRYNTYTHSKPGTASYNKFWAEQTKRRKAGMTLNCKLFTKDIPAYYACKTEGEKKKYLHPLRITGDHYNYLNFGRILRTPNDTEREVLVRTGNKKQTMIEGFPRFWDGDYWNFKIDEFIAQNGFHLSKAKARGKGYSYKRGSQGANTINLYPNVTIVLGAYLIDYLTDPQATADMLKKNLDWYETKTYYKRGYISEDLTKLELGYKEQKEGHKKKGWLSKCLSVTFNGNASAAIGKRAIEIDIEESGKCPNLDEVLRVTTSSTEVGSNKVGTIREYGTAGSKGADWAPFSRHFYSPYANSMLPLENVWDDNARHTVCGFFHPQVWNYEPFMDEHGNSQLDEAYAFDLADKLKAEKNKPLEDYLQYVAQRANKPSEAFGIGKENIFSSPELNNHIIRIQSDPSYKFYIDGLPVVTDSGVKFKSNEHLKLEGNEIHPYIENVPIRSTDDPIGCMRVFHMPYIDPSTGRIPDNLYYASYDTVGKDKKIKEFIIKNSLNAIHVYTYPNDIPGVPSDTIVASYAGRFEQMSDTDRLFDNILDMYNAKGLPEIDRGQTIEDFKKWHKLHKLLRNPTTLLENESNDNSKADYGIVIGTGERKEDGLSYTKDWLYTPIGKDSDTGQNIYILHTINDLPTLLELQRFSIEGNFDRVSSLIVGRFAAKGYRVLRKSVNIGKKKSVFELLNMYNYK